VTAHTCCLRLRRKLRILKAAQQQEHMTGPPNLLRWTDLLAGASIAGLLLPEAVAYAGLANLPPQAGVIALFAGLICYALIGRSPYAIVSATSSSAAVLAAATLTMAGDDPARRVALATMLVGGAGVAFLLAGGLKLGAMSNLIARPVLRGYAFGLAIVIAIKQWPHLVGLHVPAGSFAQVLAQIVQGVGDWRPASVGCGLAALIALFAFERVRSIPGALVVILASILASSWLAENGVALTGPIHLALAMPQFQWPARGDWLPLSEFSLALMLSCMPSPMARSARWRCATTAACRRTATSSHWAQPTCFPGCCRVLRSVPVTRRPRRMKRPGHNRAWPESTPRVPYCCSCCCSSAGSSAFRNRCWRRS